MDLMENSIDISVIVPIYNVEMYLPQCIESILEQRINLEILLIDDGSTDQSGRIADSYSQKDNRITVIHQNNLGPGEARNKGLCLARGKYIAFVDSDDWIREGSLDVLYKEAYFHQADMVKGNAISVNSNGVQRSQFNKIPQDIKYTPLTGVKCFISLMECHSYVPTVYNYLYKREWIEKENLRFQKVFYEDEIWMHEVLLMASKVIITDLEFYYYREDREGSIMNSLALSRKKITALITITNYLTKNIIYCNSINIEFRSWSLVNVYRMYYWLFSLLPKIKDSSYVFENHHLYTIFHVCNIIAPIPREICKRYYIQAKKGLKCYLKWRLSIEKEMFDIKEKNGEKKY